jgi:ribosomal protein S19E (S16A)
VRLSEKQIQTLECVAQSKRPPFKRTTVESLAKHHLVEHTSIGWRLTELGRVILDQLYPPFGNRERP